MRRISTRSAVATAQTRWAALASTLFFAVAQGLAQQRQVNQLPSTLQQNKRPLRRIIVDIPDRKLVLVEGGRVVKSYSVAVGAPASPSPTGTFEVVERILEPTYYAPGKIIPPGKENPLGTRWLGLSQRGYGIHGTNQPRSIGHRASRGCIRMRNRDIEELFELVRVGDVVELRGELAQVFGDSGLLDAAGQD